MHNLCATPAVKSYNSLTLSPLCPREMEARLGASGTSRIFRTHLSGNTGSAPTNRAVRGAIRRSAALNCLRLCHNRETLCRALFHSQRQPFWLLHSPSNAAAGRFGSRSTPLALGNFLQRGVTTAISNRLGPAGRGRVACWTIVTRSCGPLLRSIPGHSVESVRQGQSSISWRELALPRGPRKTSPRAPRESRFRSIEHTPHKSRHKATYEKSSNS